MGLDAKGKKIVECGMELLKVKEELFELSAFEPTDSHPLRAARLELRKEALLTEVDFLCKRAPEYLL